MTSTKDTLKAIQEKMKGNTKPVEESVPAKTEKPKPEKLEKSQDVKKENNYGGRRSGSGRKSLEKDEQRKTIKRQWENFASEEIEVNELHKGTREIRKIKMARLRVAQEKLFKKVQDGDVSAIREFNDRVGGKAPQTLRGGDEDDTPIQIELEVDRMLDKVYGDDKDDE